MTKELRKAIEIFSKQIKSPKRILEIGSRSAKNQVELSNLRSLFPDSVYIGTDMQKGAGVDIVADATKLPFDNNNFDLILCLETLEHAERPWEIVREIGRVSKKNGVIVLSSQQNFPLHMHPSDYFRYTPYGLSSLISGKKHKLMLAISPPFDREVELNPQHVVVIAWNGDVIKEKNIKAALIRGQSEISGHKPYRHRAQDAWRIFKRALSEFHFRHEIRFFQ